jgi:hypothetical protein
VKTVISARADTGDQSADVSATLWSSSRIATRTGEFRVSFTGLRSLP